MKTFLMLLVSLAIFPLVFSQDTVAVIQKHPTKEQVKASMERSRMKRFGGIVRQPNSEKGRIVIVNKQKLVDKSIIERFVDAWSKRYRYTFQIVNDDVKADKENIVIRVEDLSREEGIILAPENFWVSINVRSLGDDKTPRSVVFSRLMKELKRAFAFVCGATCSTEEGGLCGIVTSAVDFDAIAAELYTPDMEVRIANNMNATGVRPYRICKYSDAVQEGWAPAPTNEYQKAIWDKVHALPSAPIAIKPETKKMEK